MLRRIAQLSADSGVRVANVFHAGDGNLHPLVLFDETVQGEAERAEQVSGAIIDLCIELGGSITGEHGVGSDKAKFMPRMFSEHDLDTMQLVRCAFDPQTIFAIFPARFSTPRLCGNPAAPGRTSLCKPAGLAEAFRWERIRRLWMPAHVVDDALATPRRSCVLRRRRGAWTRRQHVSGSPPTTFSPSHRRGAATKLASAEIDLVLDTTRMTRLSSTPPATSLSPCRQAPGLTTRASCRPPVSAWPRPGCYGWNRRWRRRHRCQRTPVC